MKLKMVGVSELLGGEGKIEVCAGPSFSSAIPLTLCEESYRQSPCAVTPRKDWPFASLLSSHLGFCW